MIDSTNFNVLLDDWDSSSSIFPLDWKKFPEHILEKLPGEYLHNVYSVTDNGEISEKTVIFCEPISKRCMNKCKKESKLDSDSYIFFGIDDKSFVVDLNEYYDEYSSDDEEEVFEIDICDIEDDDEDDNGGDEEFY